LRKLHEVGFCSCEVWRHITEQFVPDISREHTAFIFEGLVRRCVPLKCRELPARPVMRHHIPEEMILRPHCREDPNIRCVK